MQLGRVLYVKTRLRRLFYGWKKSYANNLDGAIYSVGRSLHEVEIKIAVKYKCQLHSNSPFLRLKSLFSHRGFIEELLNLCPQELFKALTHLAVCLMKSFLIAKYSVQVAPLCIIKLVQFSV